jgi:hypothetical protein
MQQINSELVYSQLTFDSVIQGPAGKRDDFKLSLI